MRFVVLASTMIACAVPVEDPPGPRALAAQCAVEDLGALAHDEHLSTHPLIVRDGERWGMVHTRCDASEHCALVLTMLSAMGTPTSLPVELGRGFGGTQATFFPPQGSFMVLVSVDGLLRARVFDELGVLDPLYEELPPSIPCIAARPSWAIGGDLFASRVFAATACEGPDGSSAEVIGLRGDIAGGWPEPIAGRAPSLGHVDPDAVMVATVLGGRARLQRLDSEEPADELALLTADDTGEVERVWLSRDDARTRILAGRLAGVTWLSFDDGMRRTLVDLPGERMSDLACAGAEGWIAAAVPLAHATAGPRLAFFARIPSGEMREVEIPVHASIAGPHVEPLDEEGTFLVLFGDRGGERATVQGVRVDCR